MSLRSSNLLLCSRLSSLVMRLRRNSFIPAFPFCCSLAVPSISVQALILKGSTRMSPASANPCTSTRLRTNLKISQTVKALTLSRTFHIAVIDTFQITFGEYNVARVSGPNFITHLYQTPAIEWCVVRCESKKGHQKDILCLKEIGPLCSKFASYSRFDSQHNWEGIYGRLRRESSLLKMNKSSLYKLRKLLWRHFGFAHHCVFIILLNVRWSEKVTISDPST